MFTLVPMRILPIRPTRLAAVAALLAPAVATAADYAGTYRGQAKGQPAVVDLSPAGAKAFAGTIRLGPATLACRGIEQGDHLAGKFASGGHDFPFVAKLAGDGLTLTTGGATYTLTRGAAAPPPAVGEAKLLASTATGRTVFLSYPKAASAVDVLQAMGPTLTQVVGKAATMTGAFADAKTGATGGASFTGTDRQGRAVRGLVLCGGGGGGEAASVVFATLDAPSADWEMLRAALPTQPLKLRTHPFPDGTGSIDLPAGWTVREQSLDFGCFVKGPDGQMISIGQAFPVDAPGDQTIQMIAQTEQMARRVGIRPPPRPPMLVVPFTSPPEAIQALMPQLDKITRQTQGFGLRFGRWSSPNPCRPTCPGARRRG